MICLGLESTAHTFGAGIVDEKCSVLANEKSAFTTEKGGIKPSEAFDHHWQNAPMVVKSAFEKSGLTMKDIDVVAFSQGPGLGPCLRTSAVIARTLSLKHKKPLAGVNHAVAHIEIAKKLCHAKDPLIVYTSGGNTQILCLEAKRYRVLGETLDIGVGNLLDSFGRSLGMGFPAGPRIDGMYFESGNYIELPYSVKGMDLQFTGLLTSAEKKIGTVPEKDLSYSLMHTAFCMIAEVTERALAFTGKKEALLTGGVACSKALQKVLGEMCSARKAKLLVCPAQYAVDNAAMIAWTGLIAFRAGKTTKISESKVIQRFRPDSVEIAWS
ncbi:MAG: N(6)-L-threonylcarbamoyladenine synthase Kae1 [Candidatus Diapherotrites archaeon]|nr:N(6)-L-threonylcarbamoyladenine synthase Kae1 [Candidatus Diapherotrites archaeon]